MSERAVLHVAVPTPVRDSFDYFPPDGHDGARIPVGVRVRVPYGRRRLIGLVVGHGPQSRIDPARLKTVLEVIDSRPLLRGADLDLVHWASRYYHHPLGDVISVALPQRLRRGHAAEPMGGAVWVVAHNAKDRPLEDLRRAPLQARLLALLRDHPQGLRAAELDDKVPHWRRAMSALMAKALVERSMSPSLDETRGRILGSGPRLNSDQNRAVCTVCDALKRFAPFLLEGVTGSGKTEVYLAVIERVVQAGGQALMLVPEIGLTPQMLARFRARFSGSIAIMHSGLSHGERHRAWHLARTGEAPILIGTRSAVFAPLAAPGIIIVDEEHDASFKQQDGFRYHARDLAVYRARRHGIPVVLGSATPSLESLRNVRTGKYRHLPLHQRAGRARIPNVQVIDVRRRPLEGGLSAPLIEAIAGHLDNGGQVLLFLNRRGYAPALMCHACRPVAPAPAWISAAWVRAPSASRRP
jgi:primosomal protein N' (replication factor Y)